MDWQIIWFIDMFGLIKDWPFLVCRYVTAQRFSEALDILFSGACIELEHGLVCSLSFFVSSCALLFSLVELISY